MPDDGRGEGGGGGGGGGGVTTVTVRPSASSAAAHASLTTSPSTATASVVVSNGADRHHLQPLPTTVAAGNGSSTDTSNPRNRRAIFVSRDYTHGLSIRFDRAYPKELHGLVSEDEWASTIDTVNAIFEEAEKVCLSTVWETILACSTCYTIRWCRPTRFARKLAELNNYLEVRNQEVFFPAGLLLRDPMTRGLRCFEIVYLEGRNPTEYAV